MLARVPAARVVLVQKMESGLAEAIVGYRDDPVVGPIALVGAGGALAEIYKDYALRLAPVSEEDAEEMIERVKGLAMVRGYRGLPHGDLRALAQACRSALAACARQRPAGRRGGDQSADREARGRRRGRRARPTEGARLFPSSLRKGAAEGGGVVRWQKSNHPGVLRTPPLLVQGGETHE